MKKLALGFVLLTPIVAFAQEAVPPTLPAAAFDPIAMLRIIYTAITTGNWWMAAAAFLVLVVTLIRIYGAKLHELLPDNVIWDKPLYFLLETKPGGWLLNFATTVAGGAGTALIIGKPITAELMKPILTVALSGASLWELWKDIAEWWKVRKAAAPAPAVAPAVAPVAPAVTPVEPPKP